MVGVRLRTVDSFTDMAFSGNPAAVVVLEHARPDAWMAAVARETNLPDTGFVFLEASRDAEFRLRYFTRGAAEIDLCGHATLAAAHCLFEDGVDSPIRFATRSGVLSVSKRDDGALAMDFPAWPPAEISAPDRIAEILGATVEWTGRAGNDYLLARLSDERAVRELTLDVAKVSELPADVVIVTAAADSGQAYDFVCRVFAPRIGIDEDPVTGSAQTVLGPYWSDRLGRTSLLGLQASPRAGLVGVEVSGHRVVVSGRAITVLDGTLSPAASHVEA